MGDTPAEYLYRTDLIKAHRLAFDLMCYASTRLAASDGTLNTASSQVLDKLGEFAPSARRVLSREIPDKSLRQELMTTKPKFKADPCRHKYEPIPVIWALNGIVHAKDMWINHVVAKSSESILWSVGDMIIQGFGYETDERRLEHVDLFAFTEGYLSRSGKPWREFIQAKGMG